MDEENAGLVPNTDVDLTGKDKPKVPGDNEAEIAEVGEYKEWDADTPL